MSPIIAMDFDGVICDSAPENAATAWRCCCRLWPDRFSMPMPAEQPACFCGELRPYMETGWQSIMQTYGLWKGVPLEELTSGLAETLPKLLEETGQTVASLKALFGAERDAWLRQDAEGWYSYNAFYNGVREGLARLMADRRVVILTTKEGRFVEHLMSREGIDFPVDDIYGLERIHNKETTLKELLGLGALAFIEDRLATLERVAALPELDSVKLCFAPWGYTTPTQVAAARANPRVTVIESPLQFNMIP